MSGVEAIPIVTGIVCAVGAAKGLITGKKKKRGRDPVDYQNYRDGRHSRRSHTRRRSSSRLSRTVSLSRDTPHSIAFRYKSRSRSRLSHDSGERNRSKTPRPRRSSPERRSFRRRRYRSSSRDRERRLLDDNRACRLITPSPYDEAPRLNFCNGTVERIRIELPDGSLIKDSYVCRRCNLEIVEPGISSWHRFLASDRGEISLHKNFILRSHEARDGKFGCHICRRWLTGYKSLVSHLMDHRYTDLENVVPKNEWQGSEDWVP